MIVFRPIDEETSIEDYPGYIGMTWDGEISMSRDFRRFQDFRWVEYSAAIEETTDSRQIAFTFAGKSTVLNFEPYQDVAFLMDQLTTVEVHRDHGSSYGGMASGSGYIFFSKNLSSLDDARDEVLALVQSLESDLIELSKGA